MFASSKSFESEGAKGASREDLKEELELARAQRDEMLYELGRIEKEKRALETEIESFRSQDPQMRSQLLAETEERIKEREHQLEKLQNEFGDTIGEVARYEQELRNKDLIIAAQHEDINKLRKRNVGSKMPSSQELDNKNEMIETLSDEIEILRQKLQSLKEKPERSESAERNKEELTSYAVKNSLLQYTLDQQEEQQQLRLKVHESDMENERRKSEQLETEKYAAVNEKIIIAEAINEIHSEMAATEEKNRQLSIKSEFHSRRAEELEEAHRVSTIGQRLMETKISELVKKDTSTLQEMSAMQEKMLEMEAEMSCVMQREAQAKKEIGVGHTYDEKIAEMEKQISDMMLREQNIHQDYERARNAESKKTNEKIEELEARLREQAHEMIGLEEQLEEAKKKNETPDLRQAKLNLETLEERLKEQTKQIEAMERLQKTQDSEAIQKEEAFQVLSSEYKALELSLGKRKEQISLLEDFLMEQKRESHHYLQESEMYRSQVAEKQREIVDYSTGSKKVGFLFDELMESNTICEELNAENVLQIRTAGFQETKITEQSELLAKQALEMNGLREEFNAKREHVDRLNEELEDAKTREEAALLQARDAWSAQQSVRHNHSGRDAFNSAHSHTVKNGEKEIASLMSSSHSLVLEGSIEHKVSSPSSIQRAISPINPFVKKEILPTAIEIATTATAITSAPAIALAPAIKPVSEPAIEHASAPAPRPAPAIEQEPVPREIPYNLSPRERFIESAIEEKIRNAEKSAEAKKAELVRREKEIKMLHGKLETVRAKPKGLNLTNTARPGKIADAARGSIRASAQALSTLSPRLKTRNLGMPTTTGDHANAAATTTGTTGPATNKSFWEYRGLTAAQQSASASTAPSGAPCTSTSTERPSGHDGIFKEHSHRVVEKQKGSPKTKKRPASTGRTNFSWPFLDIHSSDAQGSESAAVTSPTITPESEMHVDMVAPQDMARSTSSPPCPHPPPQDNISIHHPQRSSTYAPLDLENPWDVTYTQAKKGHSGVFTFDKFAMGHSADEDVKLNQLSYGTHSSSHELFPQESPAVQELVHAPVHGTERRVEQGDGLLRLDRGNNERIRGAHLPNTHQNTTHKSPRGEEALERLRVMSAGETPNRRLNADGRVNVNVATMGSKASASGSNAVTNGTYANAETEMRPKPMRSSLGKTTVAQPQWNPRTLQPQSLRNSFRGMSPDRQAQDTKEVKDAKMLKRGMGSGGRPRKGAQSPPLPPDGYGRASWLFSAGKN